MVVKKGISCHDVDDYVHHPTHGIILGMVVNGGTHQYISNYWHDSYICWHIYRKKVKYGGFVKIYYLLFFCFFFFFSLYGQESETSSQFSTISPLSENQNYPAYIWNEVIGSSKIDIKRSLNGESLMGNFIADAMLKYTESDFAFISYGEIYGEIFKGEITRLDLFRLIPFSRTLVVLEISGDTLKQVIEKSLGGIHSGLAISGGKVEYDPQRPAQNRLTFVEVGEYPLYPKKIYRIVTIDYLANGFAGYDLLKDVEPERVFRTGTLLREILIDKIKQYSPLDLTKVQIDNRWLRKTN